VEKAHRNAPIFEPTQAEDRQDFDAVIQPALKGERIGDGIFDELVQRQSDDRDNQPKGAVIDDGHQQYEPQDLSGKDDTREPQRSAILFLFSCSPIPRWAYSPVQRV
jgi:hypothetical protein